MSCDDHNIECDGSECVTYECQLLNQSDPVVDAVIALWDKQGGWIPGGARQELAEALGVPVEQIRTPQEIRGSIPFRPGDQARWDGRPGGHELVSFRRYLGFPDERYAEVMTGDGVRNAPIRDLRRI